MEEHETVLSDVHLGIAGVSSTETNVISRFELVLPRVVVQQRSFGGDSNDEIEVAGEPASSDCTRDITKAESVTSATSKYEHSSENVNQTDTDSMVDNTTARDLSPPRRTRAREVILIEHHMATPLAKVGLQVWPAALLMADFLVHHGARWRNCTMLELGGGVGLCGIVSGMFAQRIICSDYLADIVDLMDRNFQRNSTLLTGEYECRVLDVRSVAFDSLKSSSSSSTQPSVDSQKVPVCDVIFASDLIYSDEITDALMTVVKGLLQRPSDAAREFYLSLERRLNFTTEVLAVSCPAYKYFIELCQRLGLLREKVDLTEIPSYFQYERSAYLELYRITLRPISNR